MNCHGMGIVSGVEKYSSKIHMRSFRIPAILSSIIVLFGTVHILPNDIQLLNTKTQNFVEVY